MILDEAGNVVRHYSNADTLYKIGDVNIPQYWIRPQQILSANAGSERFLWDMHYQPLNIPPSYPIAAVYKNTAPDATSPWVMPGTYNVKLTVDGQTFSQPLLVKMDPRVKTAIADLQKQHDMSLQCYRNRKEILDALNEIKNMHAQIKTLLPNANVQIVTVLNEFDQHLSSVETTSGISNEKGFENMNNAFTSIYGTFQETDMPPTTQAVQAFQQAQVAYKKLNTKWQDIKKNGLTKLNNELTKSGSVIIKL